MSTVLSAKPVEVPGRDLQVRVSAPATGQDLPVLLFSHGFGSSLHGYGPLTDYWAAHGFVVVQPTHLDSRTLAVPPEDPRTPDIWRYRAEDLVHVLDHLEALETAVPGLSGRVDHSRIAVAGHSFGAQTAGLLLGARVLGGDDLSDKRVTAGVLLAATGRGGADLSPFAAEHFPFMNPDFTGLTTPTLVVWGERDQSALSTRGPDWFTDVYHDSPGANALLTLPGAEHSLGGVAGYEAAETTDEHPGRVALLRRVALAHLRETLGLPEPGWAAVRAELAANPLGRLEVKPS
ncbi:dienelactone hydrolase [Crossiella equi]|uniref:Dienelactone hydrolase n=1 Tax=Crossiella equi TaxID=130796 RepID=A0ABS5AQC9_9PSEU|nr:chlorophyllase [Crossiella equi]MBP2478457.1 dienelactone hydrolase [Crossiella equi]